MPYEAITVAATENRRMTYEGITATATERRMTCEAIAAIC